MWLALRVDAKAKFVEEVLPDALRLMASNLHAGLTIDKALLLAARPEFGPLQEEIMYMGKEVTVGKDFVEALYGITKHIRSDKLLKTVNVIASSIRSGGQLAPLLEQTSRNLRDQYFIEQKIRANIKMYIIFIFAAVGVGAPMLYALSTFLVEVLTGILSGIDIPPTAGLDLPLNLAKTSIDVGFVKAYVITAILVTAVMGSFIVGLIQRGSEREGFRYIPIIVALSLTVFFVVRFLIGQLLGGLFGP